LPKQVEYYTSNDGENFELLQKITHDININTQDKIIHKFICEQNTEAQYVKVKAHNIKVCPKGHPGEGGKAWLFVDEVLVE
jgi:hexosaminidase